MKTFLQFVNSYLPMLAEEDRAELLKQAEEIDRLEESFEEKQLGLSLLFKMGTANSGNHGHGGRPGKIGGSTSTGGAKREARRGKRAGLRPTAEQKAANMRRDAEKAAELGLQHATRVEDVDGKMRLKLDNGRDLPPHLQSGLTGSAHAPSYEDVYVNMNAGAVARGAIAVRARSVNTGGIMELRDKKFKAPNEDKKWAKISQLEIDEPRLTDTILKGMKSGDLDIKENASCARLIQVSGIRAGDEDQVKFGIHGASTMKAEFVTIKNGKATFDFIGKDSVHNVIHVSDPITVADVAYRKANPVKGYLYDTTYNGKYGLLNYTKSLNKKMAYTPHNFRDLRATKWAQAKMASIKPPKTRKEYLLKQKEVATYVGGLLGHMRTNKVTGKEEPTGVTALKSYIKPNIWNTWNKGWDK